MKSYLTLFACLFFYVGIFAQAKDDIPTIRVGYGNFDKIRFPGQSYTYQPKIKESKDDRLPFPNAIKIDPPFRENSVQESKEKENFSTFRELLEYYFEWDENEMELYLIWTKNADRRVRIPYSIMRFPDHKISIERSKKITTEITEDNANATFLVQFWDVNNQCPYFEFTFK